MSGLDEGLLRRQAEREAQRALGDLLEDMLAAMRGMETLHRSHLARLAALEDAVCQAPASRSHYLSSSERIVQPIPGAE